MAWSYDQKQQERKHDLRRAGTGGELAPPSVVSSPQDVLALQRLAGNKAVTDLLAARSSKDGGEGFSGPPVVQRAGPLDSIRAGLSRIGSSIGGFFSRLAGPGKKLNNLRKTVMDKAPAPPKKDTGSDYLDAMSSEGQKQHADRSQGAIAGATPDYEDPTLADAEPDRYVVTIAAAQEDAQWLQNVQDLKSAALHKITTSPKKMIQAVKSGGGEKYLGRKVLQYRGDLEGKTEKEEEALISKFTEGLHDVGHTWIRLSTYSGGKLKALYSYGMWPQKLYDPERDKNLGGYAGFANAGPGQIRHPDVAHEGDSMKVYKDYDVSDAQFAKALGRASELFESPPPYVLIGYNCTAFAKEILEKAGQSYPGKGILPGIAYTPGNLYWAIKNEVDKNKPGAHEDDAHSDIVKQIGESQEERIKQGHVDSTWDMVGLPKETAPREKIKVYKGGKIKYGDTPRKTDQELVIDSDQELTYINDEDWTDATNIVPLVLGEKTIYATQKSVAKASKPPKPEKPGGPKPGGGGKLQLYLAQDGNLHPWEEVTAADLKDLTVTKSTDVENEAPDWASKNPGVAMVGVLWKGSWFWTMKDQLESLQSQAAPKPELQLYNGQKRTLTPAERAPMGSLVRPTGLKVEDYQAGDWLLSNPGVELLSVYWNNDERIVLKSEYEDFLAGKIPGSSAPSTGSVPDSGGGRDRSDSTSSVEGRDRSDSTGSVEVRNDRLGFLSNDVRNALSSGADLEMLLQMGMAGSRQFKDLDEQGVAELAKLMGTTTEDVVQQIKDL